MAALGKKRWSPYLVGTLIGLLAVAMLYLLDKPIDVSTSFVRTAGLIEKTFAPQHVADNVYYQAKEPKVDYQVMLVIGILVGAFLSSALWKDYRMEAVPGLWKQKATI